MKKLFLVITFFVVCFNIQAMKISFCALDGGTHNHQEDNLLSFHNFQRYPGWQIAWSIEQELIGLEIGLSSYSVDVFHYTRESDYDLKKLIDVKTKHFFSSNLQLLIYPMHWKGISLYLCNPGISFRKELQLCWGQSMSIDYKKVFARFGWNIIHNPFYEGSLTNPNNGTSRAYQENLFLGLGIRIK
jgi:hypothetical protein